jgi:hypothetical protein
MAEHVIINTPDYILTVQVDVLPKNETMVTIRRYMEQVGWVKMELYFTDDSYERFVEAIAGKTTDDAGR